MQIHSNYANCIGVPISGYKSDTQKNLKNEKFKGADNSLKNDSFEFDFKKNKSKKTILSEVEEEFNKIQQEQGLIGKTWNGIKCLFGGGSKHIKKQIEKFKKGEISLQQIKESLKKYKDGQEMSVDLVGDLVSGIASVGAIFMAPFTGGASLMLAAGVGGAVKAGIKMFDSLTSNRKHGFKDIAYDLVTGSINGLFAPITNAFGGVVGTGVAKLCGLNMLKTAVIGDGVKTAGTTFLSRLLAKQGMEYIAKEGTKAGAKVVTSKILAYGTDMAVAGSLSGAIDGFSRSLGNFDFKNMWTNIKQGFFGGLIAAPIIGGGFKVAGKAVSKFKKNTFDTPIKPNSSQASSKATSTHSSAGVNTHTSQTASSTHSSTGVNTHTSPTTSSTHSPAGASTHANSPISSTHTEAAGTTAFTKPPVSATPSSSTAGVKPNNSSPQAFTGKPPVSTTESQSIRASELSAARRTNRTSQIKTNSEIYSDPVAFSSHLEAKIQQQLKTVSEKDVKQMISSLAAELDMSELSVSEIMSRLTQFSSYQQMQGLNAGLHNNGLHGVFKYKDGKQLDLNTVMQYIGETKKQLYKIGEPMKVGFKEAYFIDSNAIDMLKRIAKDPSQYSEFIEKIKNGKMGFCVIDGWNVKNNGSYLSYGVLDKGQDLPSIVKFVAQRMKNEGLSLDDALNKDFIQEANTVLSELFEKIGVRNPSPISIIKNTNVKGNSAREIAERMSQKMPDAARIKATIDAFIDYAMPYNSDKERKIAREALSKYFDNMLSVNSSDTLAEKLKLKFASIQARLPKDKTMDDVVYLIPSENKSFNVMAYQYSKVNNVDPKRFIYYDGTGAVPISCGDLNKKVVVVLDDIVGSGKTMIGQEFKYYDLIKKYPDCNVIFAPISALKSGTENITEVIHEYGRIKKDFITANDIVNYNDFSKNLSFEERNMLEKVLSTGGHGFSSGHAVTGMPYMIPDNDTFASGLLLNELLANGAANKPTTGSESTQKLFKSLMESIIDRMKAAA